jgi:hypothetical protein
LERKNLINKSENQIVGDGSLTIEFPNARVDVTGLSAADLTVGADLTVITPDCENAVHGIVCDSSLILVNKATVTVHNGASTKYSSAVRVRGNALMEEGTTLNASVKSGTSGICKGLTVNGDLVLGKDAAIDVSVDDGATDLGECIRVSGLMEIGSGSTVTASAKNAPAIECFGSIEANKENESLLERIAVYFAFRYLLKCVNDGDLLSRAQLCVLAVLVIERLAAVCGLSEALRRFSCELEHSDENLETLQEILFRGEKLSLHQVLCSLGQ